MRRDGICKQAAAGRRCGAPGLPLSVPQARQNPDARRGGARRAHTPQLHPAVARCSVTGRLKLRPLNRSHVALRSAGACPLSTGWRREPSDKWHRATRSERATGRETEVCVGTYCHAPLHNLTAARRRPPTRVGPHPNATARHSRGEGATVRTQPLSPSSNAQPPRSPYDATLGAERQRGERAAVWRRFHSPPPARSARSHAACVEYGGATPAV